MHSSESKSNSLSIWGDLGDHPILKSKGGISMLVLIIVYTVGIIGIVSQIDERFILLTPVNLLLSLLIILLNHRNWKTSHTIFMVFCFLFGYFIEVLGVNTGIIFGQYSYGKVLGFKIWDTPLMIGVNWLILVYASCTLVNHIFRTLSSSLLKAFLAASLMVLLDILIEPVAIALGFWFWETEHIPLQNYLAWFGIAFILCYIFQLFLKDNLNFVAVILFFLQFAFFLIIGLTI